MFWLLLKYPTYITDICLKRSSKRKINFEHMTRKLRTNHRMNVHVNYIMTIKCTKFENESHVALLCRNCKCLSY